MKFIFIELKYVSILGVALPKITKHFENFDLMIDKSLALKHGQ